QIGKIKPKANPGTHRQLPKEFTTEPCAGLVSVCMLQPDIACVDKSRPVYDTRELRSKFGVKFKFNVAGLVSKKIVFSKKLRFVRTGSKGSRPECPQTVRAAGKVLFDVW